MFRILINTILIVAFGCWPAFGKYYNGSSWATNDCYYYNGSSWAACTKNYYNGSSWAEIEATADTSCDNLGSNELYYDVDHTSGTTTACVSGGTETVTFTSVTADSSWNCTSGGTNGILWDGSCNKYVEIPVGARLTTGEGYMVFSIKAPATLPTTDSELFEWRYDADEYIYAKLQYNASNGFRIQLNINDGDGAHQSTSAYKTLGTGSCYIVHVYWDATDDYMGAWWDGDSQVDTAATLATWTNTPTEGVRFGEDDLNVCYGGQSWGFDDVYFENTAPY